MRLLSSRFKWGICLLVISTVSFIFFAEYRFSNSFKLFVETKFVDPIACKELNLTWCRRHQCAALEQSFIVGNVTNRIPIAIGMGMTLRGKKFDNLTQLSSAKILFFDSFLPSFCKSLNNNTGSYIYSFYLGYDAKDPHLSKCWTRNRFLIAFEYVINKHCRQDDIGKLTLIECSYSGNPAWAQNDAMIHAYLDGAQYFYRVNDDTHFNTPGWTDKFVQALKNAPLPNAGVVAPRHSGGATDIMTYDFVHRTHIDIFGFYYPRKFRQWYADTWISFVYLINTTGLQVKHGISQKIHNIHIVHTMSDGTRYRNHYIHPTDKFARIYSDQKSYIRYLYYKNVTQPTVDGKKLIILIGGSNESSENWWGCFRNALTLPMYYPDWSMKILHSMPHSLWKTPFYQSIFDLIKNMKNVEMVYDKKYWMKAISMAFNTSYEYVLFRSCFGRLSHRDKKFVDIWINSNITDSNLSQNPSKPLNLLPTPNSFPIISSTRPMPTTDLVKMSKVNNSIDKLSNSTMLSNSSRSGKYTSMTVVKNNSSKNENINSLSFIKSIIFAKDTKDIGLNIKPILSIKDTLSDALEKLPWGTLAFYPKILGKLFDEKEVLKGLGAYLDLGGDIQGFFDAIFEPQVFSKVFYHKGFNCTKEGNFIIQKLEGTHFVGQSINEFEDALPSKNLTGLGILCEG